MSHRHKLVYAEDDQDDLYLVRQAMEKHDHIDVVHAANGQEALNLLSQMKKEQVLPCLVILDINMPVLDGKDTLRQIKSDPDLKDLPVILFSTSNSRTDQLFAETMQVELVTKPLNFSELESVALKFVDKCHFEDSKR